MKIAVINTSSEVVPLPGGGRLGPFEVKEAPSEWLHRHTSHRIKTPAEYDEMIRGLDYDGLVAHSKKRRELTEEDLDAKGKAEELREQLYVSDTDAEAA